jgi:hypothetical protein
MSQKRLLLSFSLILLALLLAGRAHRGQAGRAIDAGFHQTESAGCERHRAQSSGRAPAADAHALARAVRPGTTSDAGQFLLEG